MPHLTASPSAVGLPFSNKRLWVIIVCALCWGPLLLSCIDLRDSWALGGDEGFELGKARCVLQGRSMYREIWCDQPPLHTLVLAGLMRCFGTSPFAARLFSVACSIIILACLGLLVSRRSGTLAALVSMLLLAASPFFIQQSVAAMIGLPAVSLALLSWTILGFARAPAHAVRLGLAGLLYGLALQTKLTVLLFAPVMVFEMAQISFGPSPPSRRRSFFITGFWWLLGLGAG